MPLKRCFSGRRTNVSNPYSEEGIDGGEGGNTMNVFLSFLLAYGGRQVAEGSCLGCTHAVLTVAQSI